MTYLSTLYKERRRVARVGTVWLKDLTKNTGFFCFSALLSSACSLVFKTARWLQGFQALCPSSKHEQEKRANEKLCRKPHLLNSRCKGVWKGVFSDCHADILNKTW